MESGGINWLAISGLATFVVAVVALIPIFREYLKRKRMAENLRKQICHHLLMVRPYISLMSEYFSSREPLSKTEQEPVKALEQLFSQGHMLTSQEHDSLSSIIFRLSAFSRLGQPEIEDADNILPHLEEAIRQFGGEKHLTSDEDQNDNDKEGSEEMLL